MEQSPQSPQAAMGIIPGSAQIAYGGLSYAPPMETGAQAVIGAIPSPTHVPTGTTPFPSSHQLPYQQVQQFHHQQQQQLQSFWASQMHEIDQTTDFKNHSLPLARIKKIMKADEDVRMISAEAPVIFAKACEIFILELTLRSWIHAEENKRRTLQKNDIAAAITRTDIFDFLVDIVPRDEMKEDAIGIPRGTAAVPDSVPYYYMPPAQPQVGGAGMLIGKQVDQLAAGVYSAAPQAHPMYVWQQQMPDGG